MYRYVKYGLYDNGRRESLSAHVPGDTIVDGEGNGMTVIVDNTGDLGWIQWKYDAKTHYRGAPIGLGYHWAIPIENVCYLGVI